MTIEEELRALADKYAMALKGKIDARVEEMESDDHSHYLIYQVLGVTDEEGRLIDIYQNKGRFLYKYAGSFLEEATKICFLRTFPDSGSLKIPQKLRDIHLLDDPPLHCHTRLQTFRASEISAC